LVICQTYYIISVAYIFGLGSSLNGLHFLMSSLLNIHWLTKLYKDVLHHIYSMVLRPHIRCDIFLYSLDSVYKYESDVVDVKDRILLVRRVMSVDNEEVGRVYKEVLHI
jgi:hypothetical protein